MSQAEPMLLSEAGSERATTGPGNNIVTQAGRTHVVWQDVDAKGYWAKIRTFDRAAGTWSPTVTLGPGFDNHARPCIAIDHQGHLHVIIGGHNTMMHYRKSVNPNDSSAWTKLENVDIGTYPTLVCGPDDTLVLGARIKTGGGINLYVRGSDQKHWETRELVRRNPKYSGYAGYNVALAWGPSDGLHFAADVYEGRGYTDHRGTHQAIVYMTSPDLGKTWKKSDGTRLPHPATPEKLDILGKVDVGGIGPAQPALLRNGGVAADSQGRVFLYFTENKDGVSRPRLTTPEQGVWRELPLAEAFAKRWPNYQVRGARGHLTIDAHDHLHVLVEFSETPPKGVKVERFENTIGIGLLSSPDAGKTFEARELLPLDPKRRCHQASLERQVGHNDLSRRLPSAIFTEGLQRYPEKGEVINNKVYWLQP